MRNKNKINIAILGCGRISNHYLDIFNSKKINNFKILICVDIKKIKAKKFSKNFNAKYSNNYQDILKVKDIDLVIILTPSGLHYEHCRYFLNNHINVLVEKPPAMKTSQIKKLIKFAEINNLLFCVAYQNRLNNSIQLMKGFIEKRKFGKIITASIRLRWCRYQDYYNDEWHGKWSLDGGVTNQQAIHHIDALNWLLGPIESVCCLSSNRLNKLEAEDTMVGVLNFESGATGTIELTTAARPRDFEASLSIVGEKGQMSIGGVGLNKIENLEFTNNNVNLTPLVNKNSEKVKNGYGNSHIKILSGAINYLRTKKVNKNIVFANTTISTSILIHSIYKSDEIKKWVYIKDQKNSSRLGNNYVRK